MGGGGSGGSAGGHLVYDQQFTPKAAWALESDDAFLLSTAGCLETLTKYGFDGQLEPMLATSWKQVDDTDWDFTLRDGVKFQDGTAMNADTVVGALKHLLAAKTPAKSFNPKVISGVEAVDPTTVRITTPAADPLVPLRLASPNTGILAPKAFAGAQTDIMGTCTGPFEVTGEVANQSISLKANTDYWDGKPKLDSVEVRFIPEGATRATQLQAGEAQIARDIPASSVSTVKSEANLDVIERAQPRTTVMLLNNSRPPFNNPLVRQAVQVAVNSQAIVDSVYEGLGQPAVGPFSPDSPWAPEGAQALSTGNLDKAKQLFQQAGVDPSSLTIQLLSYTERAEFSDVAAVIQDQLGQLGITVKIKAADYASLEPAMLSGDFDATLLSRGYLVYVADPGGYLQSDFTCDGGYNIAHYCDPETDQMIKDAAAIADQTARNQKYAEIAKRLEDQAASVWLLHEQAAWGVQNTVQNFKVHPLDYYVITKDLALNN
jgi:peptide/nickel transport system substrate-binding protein